MLFFQYNIIPDKCQVLVSSRTAHATYLVKVTTLGGPVNHPVTGTSEEAIMTDASTDRCVLIAITRAHPRLGHVNFTKWRSGAEISNAPVKLSAMMTNDSFDFTLRIALESTSKPHWNESRPTVEGVPG